jgi:hypothetical protein
MKMNGSDMLASFTVCDVCWGWSYGSAWIRCFGFRVGGSSWLVVTGRAVWAREVMMRPR